MVLQVRDCAGKVDGGSRAHQPTGNKRVSVSKNHRIYLRVFVARVLVLARHWTSAATPRFGTHPSMRSMRAFVNRTAASRVGHSKK